MTEFEIKLEVPPAAAGAVRGAVSRLGPKAARLRAIYYDTPERLLQRERLALRVRFENGHWVQTLKGAGAQAHERLEHNVDLGRGRSAPKPAAARHAGSEPGDRLLRVLGAGFDDHMWEPLFETDVERMTALVDAEGSQVEIAFDRGRIMAGARETPLCEIEFEWKEGEASAAVELARRWCVRYALAVSTISKAQKGVRLFRNERFGEATAAGDVEFGKRASLARIGGHALAASLDQVIANASELALGSEDEEHVHQARVGIRRARTALRELLGEEGSPEELALIHAFRELGKHRDAHHVLGSADPRAPHTAPAPSRVVCDLAFQDALLSLLARACRLQADDAPARGVKAEIAARLDSLLRKSLRDGTRFDSIDPLRQHRVRKRLKRLRYLAEFTAPLHDDKALRKYLRKLKTALDALGEYNDDVTLLAQLRASPDPESNWFAVAWLEAERGAGAWVCRKALRKLARVPPFWGRHA